LDPEIGPKNHNHFKIISSIFSLENSHLLDNVSRLSVAMLAMLAMLGEAFIFNRNFKDPMGALYFGGGFRLRWLKEVIVLGGGWPGDILLITWNKGTDFCVNFTITSPLFIDAFPLNTGKKYDVATAKGLLFERPEQATVINKLTQDEGWPAKEKLSVFLRFFDIKTCFLKQNRSQCSRIFSTFFF